VNPNIAARLLDGAGAYPDRPAIVELRGGRRGVVGYAELARRVAAVGQRLREAGIAPGDRVLLLVPMSIDLYVALLGTLHAGAVAVFLDAWAGRARIDAAVEVAEPKLLIGTWKARLLRFVSPAVRRIPRRWSSRSIAANVRAEQTGGSAPAAVGADHPALVTFTTGSTGAPKAAERSHGFLWAQHRSLAGHMEMRAGEIDMPTLPIFVLNNLALGVTSVIPDFDPRRPGRIDPRAIARQLDAERITTASGSPAFFSTLCRWSNERGRRLPLRALWTGGAPVYPPLARLMEATIDGHAHIVYGSTEAEPIAGVPAAEMVRLAEEAGPGICVGRPVPEIELRLVRPVAGPIELGARGWSEWECLTAEVGEIVVAGPHVLGSYLNAPEQTRRTKILDGDRSWHRTGDAGRVDSEGRLWLMGRVDQRVERAGDVVWPTPVEASALTLSGVAHAAYLGVPDPELGHRAVLCLEEERSASHAPSDAEIRRALAPSPIDRVVRLRRIPRDPRHESKTDVAKLRDRIR
jgi:olefin beta-lactone synthetase